MRWKALIEMEKQQQDQVDRNIKEAREKLEMEMEAARHEHQVMLMRQGGCRNLLVLTGCRFRQPCLDTRQSSCSFFQI